MTKTRRVPTSEDVGNIVAMEHVNLTVPDQGLATLFYVAGLGGTRDPYLMVGVDNMWVNLGGQQFHLPTRDPQIIPGHIGLVVPDLDSLQARLREVKGQLADTRFNWSVRNGYVEVTCPWGNHLRCYAPSQEFGDMTLGISYVEFLTGPGTVHEIKDFYVKAFRVPGKVSRYKEGTAARIPIGQGQALIFRETDEPLPLYDGHHIAVYVANFSSAYKWLSRRRLITEELANHQFRFKDIVDPKSGKTSFEVEHEVRSMRHPMYKRHLVNRNLDQTLRSYVKGRDALS